jgi:hypothetical protein
LICTTRTTSAIAPALPGDCFCPGARSDPDDRLGRRDRRGLRRKHRAPTIAFLVRTLAFIDAASDRYQRKAQACAERFQHRLFTRPERSIPSGERGWVAQTTTAPSSGQPVGDLTDRKALGVPVVLCQRDSAPTLDYTIRFGLRGGHGGDRSQGAWAFRRSSLASTAERPDFPPFRAKRGERQGADQLVLRRKRGSSSPVGISADQAEV